MALWTSGFEFSPPRIRRVDCASTTATGTTLSWTAVVGADEYVVQQSADGGTTWTTLTPNPTTATKAVTGLTTATAYKFRVAAVVDGAASAYCDPITVTTS